MRLYIFSRKYIPLIVRIFVSITNVEAGIATVRNLIGRHTVIFQTGTIIDSEFRTYLPVIRKVGSQFVFGPFGIFRTQLIETTEFSGTPVSCHTIQYLRIFSNRAYPLKRRRVIIQMIKPFIQPQAYVMVAYLLFQFGSKQCVLHFAKMQPGTPAFDQSAIGILRTILKKAVRHRGFADVATTKVHIVSFGSIHKLGIQRPVQIVTEGIIKQHSHFMRLIACEVTKPTALHLSVHHIHVLKTSTFGGIRRSS